MASATRGRLPRGSTRRDPSWVGRVTLRAPLGPASTVGRVDVLVVVGDAEPSPRLLARVRHVAHVGGPSVAPGVIAELRSRLPRLVAVLVAGDDGVAVGDAMGQAPHSLANAASELMRCGLSPAAARSWAATWGPTPESRDRGEPLLLRRLVVRVGSRGVVGHVDDLDDLGDRLLDGDLNALAEGDGGHPAARAAAA